jgi:hypothetical protein
LGIDGDGLELDAQLWKVGSLAGLGVGPKRPLDKLADKAFTAHGVVRQSHAKRLRQRGYLVARKGLSAYLERSA